MTLGKIGFPKQEIIKEEIVTFNYIKILKVKAFFLFNFPMERHPRENEKIILLLGQSYLCVN